MRAMLLSFLCICSSLLANCHAIADHCLLPSDEGPCDNLMVRWAYNASEENCQPFVYGGCLGNKNNFYNEESCLLDCAQMEDDPCARPMDQGACANSTLRWHYNAETEQCEKFLYNGCMGNTNNFPTRDECQAKCQLDLADSLSTTLFANVDRCAMPKIRGPCSAIVRRWFFNNDTQQCDVFIYGGCKGSRNNFVTQTLCQSKCGKVNEVNPCEQSMQPGTCTNTLLRWYFSNSTGQCEKFLYSGCGSNENNFETKQMCEKKCGIASIPPEMINPCEQAMKAGPCRMSVIRWYFDETDDVCKPFIYGGCQGNDNNFETMEECSRKCPSRKTTLLTTSTVPTTTTSVHTAAPVVHRLIIGQTPRIGPSVNQLQSLTERPIITGMSLIQFQCQLAADQGACDKALIRWHFNFATRQCEKFLYSGCGGNANRFLTKEDCLRHCSVFAKPSGTLMVPMPAARNWRHEKSFCYRDDQWCSLMRHLCYRSKLECLEVWSPKDVTCLSLVDGFYLLNPAKPCSRHFFTCLTGRFSNHTCQEPYRFDTGAHMCRPAQYIAACRRLLL